MIRRMLLPAALWLALACGCAGPEHGPGAVPGLPVAVGDIGSDPALQAMAFPCFFGRADAPHTLILYTNPQCPPCRTSWKAFPALMRELDPARIRLIVAGYGFADEGTRLMFVAAGLAEQRPDLATAFLSDVMAAGSEPYTGGRDWVEAWLGRAELAGNWDEARFRRLIGSREAAGAYLEGVERIRAVYGLDFTPALLIDGRLHTGPHTAEAIRERLIPFCTPGDG